MQLDRGVLQLYLQRGGERGSLKLTRWGSRRGNWSRRGSWSALPGAPPPSGAGRWSLALVNSARAEDVGRGGRGCHLNGDGVHFIVVLLPAVIEYARGSSLLLLL